MIAGERQRMLRASAAVAGFGAAILLALFGGCSSPSQAPSQRGESARAPVQSFENLQLRETSEGKLEWILRAQKATRASASDPTRLERLRVDFYQGSDQVRSVLTSDSGQVDTQKGTLIALGRVVVVTREGSRLETEELTWDRKTTRVSSEKFVRLIRGRDVLTGIGFRSDPNLVSYEILKDVNASVREETGIGDEFFGTDSVRVAR
jgi:LPS export ABC transporter protein LptC